MKIEIFESSGLILTFVGLFLIIAVGIGLYYRNRIDDTEDFAAAGRSLTWPYVMASVVATWIGAAVIIGGATEVYEYGFQGIIWDPFAPCLTLIIAGLFFVKRLRKTKHITVGDYYDSRYGVKMGTIFSVIQATTGIAWVAAQFKSFGVLIHMTTGFDANIATVVGAVVILFVAMAGGLWALSRTDMLAFIVISLSLILMVPYTLSAVGGFENFFANAGNTEELPQWSLFYNFGHDSEGSPYGLYWYGGFLGLIYAISAWLAVGIGDLSCPVLNARTLAAKSEQHASTGFLAGGIVYLFLGMIPVFIGISAFIVSDGGIGKESLDYVLPWFVQNYMPSWLGIMFMVSLAAAIVSTSGDTILIDSTVFGNSIFKRLNPDITDTEMMRKLKWVLPIYALIGYGVTFVGGIYELLVFAGAALFPTVAASYIFGLFWKKANQTGALASFWVGSGSWIFLTFFVFLPLATNYFDENVSLFNDFAYIFKEGYLDDACYIAAVPAFFLSIITLVVVSLKTQERDVPKVAVDIHGNELDAV